MGQFDPNLGWVMRPNVADHNERGYRKNGNESITLRKEAVLAIGDSYTYGAEVRTRDTWPSNLERLLRLKVINGGVGGYGLAQMLIRTQNALKWARPNTVIVAPISDDLWRTKLQIRHGFRQPYFRLNDLGQLELVPATDLSEYRPDIFKRTFGYSHFVHLFMRRTFREYWMKGSPEYFQEAAIDNVPVSKAIIDRFVDLVVNRKKMELLFVGLPAYTNDDYMSVRSEGDREELYMIAEYMREVAGNEQSVQYLDLQAKIKIVFPQESIRAKMFHTGENSAGHYNSYGTQFVARVIAEKFNARGQLTDSEPNAEKIGRKIMQNLILNNVEPGTPKNADPN